MAIHGIPHVVVAENDVVTDPFIETANDDVSDTSYTDIDFLMDSDSTVLDTETQTEKKELDILKEKMVDTINQVFKEKKTKVAYMIGTMIEVPRAALTADRVAESAQFFSFGTNDLTQTALGLSRDDASSFLPVR